jgi:hypothetical protein
VHGKITTLSARPPGEEITWLIKSTKCNSLVRTISAQAIAVELADYSKKVFEQGTAATEKLIGAKSIEKAFEVQSDYIKSSYEGFVAEATKLGELYVDFAKEAYKPFESQFSKVTSVK